MPGVIAEQPQEQQQAKARKPTKNEQRRAKKKQQKKEVRVAQPPVVMRYSRARIGFCDTSTDRPDPFTSRRHRDSRGRRCKPPAETRRTRPGGPYPRCPSCTELRRHTRRRSTVLPVRRCIREIPRRRQGRPLLEGTREARGILRR